MQLETAGFAQNLSVIFDSDPFALFF